MSTKTRGQLKVTDLKTLRKVLTSEGWTFTEGTNLSTSAIHRAEPEKVDVLLTGRVSKGADGKAIAIEDKECRTVGFKKTSTGEYEAVGDFYHLQDSKGRNMGTAHSMQTCVNRRYAYFKGIEAMEKLGFGQKTKNPRGEVGQDGKIRVRMRLTDPAMAGLA